MGIFDSVSQEVPFLNISGISIFNFITYLILFCVFLVFITVGVIVTIYLLTFNKKVVIFERVDEKMQPSKRSRAKFMKFGKAGDEILYIRKLKKYQPHPKLQTGINTYWFWIREDGELINFTTGDFDMQARELGAEFLDLEMRHARTALQSQLKDRYVKPKWLEKYGPLLINIVAITIIMVFLWIIVGELVKVIGSLREPVEAAADVVKATESLINKLDNVCSGGASGLRPAPTT